jgi:RNA polymerase sigma-70 factor (ECF subfamily)
MIAEQTFTMWRGRRSDGTLSDGEIFAKAESGARDGALAILESIGSSGAYKILVEQKENTDPLYSFPDRRSEPITVNPADLSNAQQDLEREIERLVREEAGRFDTEALRTIRESFMELRMAAAAIAVTGMTESDRTRDRDLLERFRVGDCDAFTEIYRAHKRAVSRFALFMTGDEIKAAEVTQDVFVWLIHHPQDFDPARGELDAFLVGVARKLLKRRFAEEHRWVSLNESTAGAMQLPADRNEADYLRLRKAIAALPERYRAVVVLCDLEERTYEEAAAIVECAVGTVRSRLHRARAMLTRKLVGRGCPA